MIYLEYATPLGGLILAANRQGLAGAWFVGQKHFGGIADDWQHAPDDGLLRSAAQQIEEWFAGQRTRFALPLAPDGTPFQQTVWQAISQIEFGHTCSYGELANALGLPTAARAVGAATGRNPLSIIIPCHRLLGQSGALTGYAGGLDRKQRLLAFEACQAFALRGT